MKSNKRTKGFKKVIFMIMAIMCGIGISFIPSTEVMGESSSNMKYSVELSPNKSYVESGEVVKVKLHVENDTEKDNFDFKAKLMIDGNSEVIGSDTKEIKKIPLGESTEITWEVKANTGASKIFIGVIEKNNKAFEIKASNIAVKGEGWFIGDNHTHTTYSDGQGTIAENFDAAREVGLNYVSITDHNNSLGWNDAQREQGEDLIVIRGNEYTSKSCHAVIMNVSDEKNYSGMNTNELCKYIKTSYKNPLVYAAHPYESAYTWKEEEWDSDIDGIEVWNGWWGAKYKPNCDAFAKWDELNKEGRHIYGIATTDNHESKNIGKTYTAAYLKEFSSEGVIEAHKKGHIYGSNGPVIDFKIGDVMMGDDLHIKNNKVVTVKMSGKYHKKLSKVTLIKNGETIYSKDLDNNEFNISQNVQVKPGDFLRMEVQGKESEDLKLDCIAFDSAPFAFSNPIFIVNDN